MTPTPSSCPWCSAPTRGADPVCWMCFRPVAFAPPSPPPVQPISAFTQHLWLFGVIVTGALVLTIFGGLLAAAPGLAVLFALAAVPVMVLLVRALARERSGEGNSPIVRGLAMSVLVLGAVIGGLVLLFVAACTLFLVLCMAMGGSGIH